MRLLALPLFAALAFTRDGAPEPVAARVAPPPLAAPAEVTEPAPLEALTPQPLPLPEAAIRETRAPVPGDVAVDVRKGNGAAWSVRLSRKGYLVAMRRGDARSAGANQATLAMLPGDVEPVVWEATRLDTLATTRGTLRLEAPLAGQPKPRPLIHLAEAPVAAGREERRLHVCSAHEDGAGGFSVLCQVRANPTAANVTGDDEKADVWVTAGSGGSPVVRLDLPASPAGVEARMVGYAAGADGVVIRAEASRVAGEAQPVLTLFSADRPQPQVPRRTVRYICCRRPLADLL